MKLQYFPETDSLYIELLPESSVDSQELPNGIVLDFDAQGNLTGIDIDQASQKLDLRELVFSKVPIGSQPLTA